MFYCPGGKGLAHPEPQLIRDQSGRLIVTHVRKVVYRRPGQLDKQGTETVKQARFCLECGRILDKRFPTISAEPVKIIDLAVVRPSGQTPTRMGRKRVYGEME